MGFMVPFEKDGERRELVVPHVDDEDKAVEKICDQENIEKDQVFIDEVEEFPG